MEHRPASRVSPSKRAGYLLKAAVPINQGKLSQSLDELVKELLSGQTAIFLEGCGEPSCSIPANMRCAP